MLRQINTLITDNITHPFKGVCGSVSNRGDVPVTIGNITLLPTESYAIPWAGGDDYEMSLEISFQDDVPGQKLLIIQTTTNPQNC